jgi:hypothetical protein
MAPIIELLRNKNMFCVAIGKIWRICLGMMAISTFLSNEIFAASYYIDFINGSNSNTGTSTGSAWTHMPGMQGCNASCSAKTPQAGDRFILKGGVTWPSSALGINWQWSGSAGNSIYVGIDKSWYAGGQWTRPVLDGGQTNISNNNVFFTMRSYVILDNIEFTGLYWSGTPAWWTSNYIALYQYNNFEVKNCYFHGWAHSSNASDTQACIVGDSHIPNQNIGGSVHDCVFDGYDGDQASMYGIYGGPPICYKNVFRNMSNGMVLNGAILIHDNLFENIARSFDINAHSNGFESNTDGPELLFYNNILRHTDVIRTASKSPAGVTLWVAPQKGNTTYLYNNVIYDATPGNIIVLGDALTNPGGSAQIINNSVKCGPDGNANQPAIRMRTSILGIVVLNNHFITANSTVIEQSGSGTIYKSNLIVQNEISANAQGYTSERILMPSIGGATLNAGINQDSLFSNDILGNSRQQQTWDVGAYQFSLPSPQNLRILQ